MPKKQVKGLSLRGGVYWADFRHNKQRYRKSLGTGNRKVAEELLTEWRSRILRGDFGLIDNDVNLEDIFVQLTTDEKEVS